MLLRGGLRAPHPRDTAGGADLVDVAGPAVVEHPFVAPLVAKLLDQRRYEARDGVIGMDRRFRIKLLHGVDDRRGILNASALRRDHQGNDRHPGVCLVFGLARGVPQNPLMRNGLVAKITAYLDRVGRHLGADDAIAVRHSEPPAMSLTAFSPALSRDDLYHLKHRVERTRVANASAQQT